jgi:hypothetical protein
LIGRGTDPLVDTIPCEFVCAERDMNCLVGPCGADNRLYHARPEGFIGLGSVASCDDIGGGWWMVPGAQEEHFKAHQTEHCIW